LQLQAAGLGARGEQGPADVEQIGGVGVLELERKLAGVGAGQDKQGFDHGLHALGDVAALVDGGDVGGFIAWAGAADFEGGQQRRQGSAKLVGDVGGEGFFAGEGGFEMGKKPVELVDHGRKLGGRVARTKANGQIVFAELVDVGSDAFDGPDRPADDPDQDRAADDDGQATPSREQPAEILQRALDGEGIAGDAEDDGAGAVGVGGIARGIRLNGGGKRHGDHAPGPAVGQEQVVIADGGARGRPGKIAVAEGRGSDDDAGIDPGLEIIGMICGNEFGQFVWGIVEDDLLAVLLGGGGDGASLGEEGLIVFRFHGSPDAEIQGQAEQSQDDGGAEGGVNEQAEAKGADHAGSSSARRYPCPRRVWMSRGLSGRSIFLRSSPM